MIQQTGISVIYPPLLSSDVLLISRDCNVVLSASHLRGHKIEMFYVKGRHAALFVAFLGLCELILLSNQIQTSSTQTVLNNFYLT